MHIRKLDPEINPITLKDGRGGIFTYYPEQGDPEIGRASCRERV